MVNETMLVPEQKNLEYIDIVNCVRSRLKTVEPDIIPIKKAFQVDITGGAEGTFYIKIADGLIAVEPYDYRDHNARFMLSAEDLLDLMEKRLSISEALAEGKIHIEGDWDSVMEMNRILEQLK